MEEAIATRVPSTLQEVSCVRRIVPRRVLRRNTGAVFEMACLRDPSEHRNGVVAVVTLVRQCFKVNALHDEAHEASAVDQ